MTGEMASSWFSRKYCIFVNFRKNFIFANIIKRNISDVNNARFRQDVPISINHRVILPYAKFRENKTLAKISEFTVNVSLYNKGWQLSC